MKMKTHIPVLIQDADSPHITGDYGYIKEEQVAICRDSVLRDHIVRACNEYSQLVADRAAFRRFAMAAKCALAHLGTMDPNDSRIIKGLSALTVMATEQSNELEARA